MKIEVDLQNINGDYADIWIDGNIIMTQYYFCNGIPSASGAGGGSNNLADDLINLKSSGIRVTYD